MPIISIYDLSDEQIKSVFKGKTKIPGIIDLDEILNESNLNYSSESEEYESCLRKGLIFGYKNSEKASPLERDKETDKNLQRILDSI